MVDISTYLSNLAADYTTITLDVTPQNVMVEEGTKNQIIHEMDDGKYYVTTLSDSFFNITLEWTYLSDTGGDAETILTFYHDSNRANGSARTFYWKHPLDGNTYTVRFLGPLRRVYKVNMPSGKSVAQITLRVEGKKAT